MRAEYLQCPQRNDSGSGRVEAFSGSMKFQSYEENSGEIEPAINLWLLLKVKRVTKQKCYCCCSSDLDFTGTNPTRCEFAAFITKAGMGALCNPGSWL